MSSPAPLDDTVGAMLIGYTVSTLLLGISMTQVYLYVIRFPKDLWWIKTLVAAVYIPELLHFISIAHAIYGKLVDNFGNVPALLEIPVGFHISSMAGVYVSTVVKGYFIYRIWSLSQSIIISVILVALGLAAAAMYLYANVAAIRTHSAVTFSSQYSAFLIACSSLSAACDAGISLSLIWLLRRRLRGSDRVLISAKIIEKLTAWTLETGLLTTTFNLGLAISVGVNSHNFIWLAFWFCLCRCYANSMLATLNGRTVLRSLDAKSHTFSLPSTSFSVTHSVSRGVTSDDSTELRSIGSSGRPQPMSIGSVGLKTETDPNAEDHQGDHSRRDTPENSSTKGYGIT